MDSTRYRLLPKVDTGCLYTVDVTTSNVRLTSLVVHLSPGIVHTIPYLFFVFRVGPSVTFEVSDSHSQSSRYIVWLSLEQRDLSSLN